MLKNDDWANIAKKSEEDIREYILSGYKAGKPFRGDILNYIGAISQFGRLLEFGCGIGRNFESFKSMSREMVAVDIPEMVQACKKFKATQGVHVTSDFQAVCRQKFDLCVSTLVFQHIKNRQECINILQDLARCCARLHITSRGWSDAGDHDNVAQRIADSGAWEYESGSLPEREMCRLEYPSDVHYAVTYRSRHPGMQPVLDEGPTACYNPPEPETRVGFLTPSLIHPGGAEKWIRCLIENMSPRIGKAGVCVTTKARSWEAVQAIENHCPVMFGPDSLPILFDRSDIIIAWGLEDLPNMTKDFKGKLVVVSHGSCSWTKKVMAIAAPIAHRLVAVSKASAKTYPPDSDVTVIHNGIDPGSLKPSIVRSAYRMQMGLGEDEKAIGYIGRFSFEKNPVAAAIAAEELGEGWRPVYVGSGWQEDLVKAEVERQTDKAIFHPVVDNVANVLNALDCFVLASPSEGMSLSIIEAWMTKLPVVATKVGALEELMDEHGQLVTEVALYPSREDLAQKILWATGTDVITDRAHKMAHKYLTAKGMSDKYEELLLEVHHDDRPAGCSVPRPKREGPVRVGIVSPSLTFPGGAERWILSMLKMEHPDIKWQGVSVVGPDRHWPCVEEAQKVCSVLFGGTSAHLLAQNCDVILSWGLNELMDYIPGYQGKVISVAQGCGEWTRKILTEVGVAADACVGISEFAAAAFPEGTAPHIIYNGTEPDRVVTDLTMTRAKARAAIGLEPGDVAVGYIGRYSPEKNPLAAAEAVSVLGAPFRAVYMGAGRIADEVIEEVRKLDPQAILLEPREHVREVLKALDCFVMASPAEGGCIAFGEAWAMGVPVVGTPVGVLPELEAKYGKLSWRVPIEPDKGELAKAVQAATTDRAVGEVTARAKDVAWNCLMLDKMHEDYARLILELAK